MRDIPKYWNHWDTSTVISTAPASFSIHFDSLQFWFDRRLTIAITTAIAIKIIREAKGRNSKQSIFSGQLDTHVLRQMKGFLGRSHNDAFVIYIRGSRRSRMGNVQKCVKEREKLEIHRSSSIVAVCVRIADPSHSRGYRRCTANVPGIGICCHVCLCLSLPFDGTIIMIYEWFKNVRMWLLARQVVLLMQLIQLGNKLKLLNQANDDLLRCESVSISWFFLVTWGSDLLHQLLALSWSVKCMWNVKHPHSFCNSNARQLFLSCTSLYT